MVPENISDLTWELRGIQVMGSWISGPDSERSLRL